MLFALYLAPLLALVAALVCRRHAVLLWLGGLITAGMAWWTLRLTDEGHRQMGDASVITEMVRDFAAVPLLAAGVVLLVGGLIRWGVARRRARRPGSGDRPSVADPQREGCERRPRVGWRR